MHPSFRAGQIVTLFANDSAKLAIFAAIRCALIFVVGLTMAQTLQQLCNIGRDPPRLVFDEQSNARPGSRLPRVSLTMLRIWISEDWVKQLRQLGKFCCNPPRLIFGEQLAG
jgi:hypothetical protein